MVALPASRRRQIEGDRDGRAHGELVGQERDFVDVLECRPNQGRCVAVDFRADGKSQVEEVLLLDRRGCTKDSAEVHCD